MPRFCDPAQPKMTKSLLPVATRHKRTHTTLTPATPVNAGARFTYPGGVEG